MRLLATLAAALALTACSDDEQVSSTERTTTERTTTETVASECRPTTGGEAQGNATASPDTPSTVKLGPGPDITPEEAAAEAPARRGTPLLLSGTVYAADCRTPLAGAVIDAWQTDARGVYGPGQDSGELRCCYLQGLLKTDSQGNYRIQTIRPGHYRGETTPPPAHIHLNVSHGEGGVLTEVVFAGDPYVSEDTDAVRLRTEGGSLVGRFDIVLADAS